MLNTGLLLPVLAVWLGSSCQGTRLPLSDDFPDFPAFPDLSDLFRPPSEEPRTGFRDYRDPDEDSSSEDLSMLGDQEEDDEEEDSRGGRKPGSVRRRYPQIFKFNKDRVNLADFDRRKKKLGLEYSRNDGLDPDLVPRRKFLVLRGGTFKSWNY